MSRASVGFAFALGWTVVSATNRSLTFLVRTLVLCVADRPLRVEHQRESNHKSSRTGIQNRKKATGRSPLSCECGYFATSETSAQSRRCRFFTDDKLVICLNSLLYYRARVLKK